MSKNYAVIIQFVPPLTTFYRPRAQRSDVYKRDVFVTSWRFHNRAWQPRRHDRLPETSGTLWIHRGALTNQRCSLATGCGITIEINIFSFEKCMWKYRLPKWWPSCLGLNVLNTRNWLYSHFNDSNPSITVIIDNKFTQIYAGHHCF